MSNPVKIVAILAARVGKTEELKVLVYNMVAACRTEPGNLRWDIWQDQANGDRFVLDELYTNSAAVAAHRETPHFKNYLGRINDLAERTAVVADPLQVA